MLEALRGRETILQPRVLYCASLLLAFFASPVLAQQVTPGRQVQLAQQMAAGQAAQPANTDAQSPSTSVAPLPPPFPPMPSSRPSHRWVDMGEHHVSRGRHKAAPARHVSKSDLRRGRKKLAAEDHRSLRHHGRSDVRRSHRELAKDRPSAKTIRRCHDMSYKQIMRSSSCRALMKQELSGLEHRDRPASHHRKSASHRHAVKAHRHSVRKHRR